MGVRVQPKKAPYKGPGNAADDEPPAREDRGASKAPAPGSVTRGNVTKRWPPEGDDADTDAGAEATPTTGGPSGGIKAKQANIKIVQPKQYGVKPKATTPAADANGTADAPLEHPVKDRPSGPAKRRPKSKGKRTFNPKVTTARAKPKTADAPPASEATASEATPVEAEAEEPVETAAAQAMAKAKAKKAKAKAKAPAKAAAAAPKAAAEPKKKDKKPLFGKPKDDPFSLPNEDVEVEPADLFGPSAAAGGSGGSGDGGLFGAGAATGGGLFGAPVMDGGLFDKKDGDGKGGLFNFDFEDPLFS